MAKEKIYIIVKKVTLEETYNTRKEAEEIVEELRDYSPESDFEIIEQEIEI